MRRFSEEDEGYIRAICQASGRLQSNVQNLLDRHLAGVLVNVNMTDNTVTVLFDKREIAEKGFTDEFLEKLCEIERTFVRLLRLLEWLEKEGYIVTYSSTTLPQPEGTPRIVEFGQGIINDCKARSSVPDHPTVALLVQYVDKELIPMPALRALVGNDFRSEEEVRFGKQQKATWVAIGVAILAVVVPMVWTIVDSRSQAKETKEYRYNDVARWQALLATESNKVLQVGKMNNILSRLSQSFVPLTNQVQTVNKPTPSGGDARKQTVR